MKDLSDQQWDWLEGYRNGTLNEDAFGAFEKALEADADLRAAFLRYQSMDTGLRDVAEEDVDRATTEAWRGETISIEVAQSAAPKKTWSVGWRWAAVLGLLVLGGRVVILEMDGSRASDIASAETTEAKAQGVAVVTRLVDATWGDGEASFEVGEALTPGRWVMASGLAQIEFFSGATVVIEGPAELELESAWTATCLSGRLRAQVPPAARGFTIHAEGMKVVDLGTEFGMSVSPEGASVQVFDGEVELHSGDAGARLIEAGDAVTHNAASGIQAAALTESVFLGIEDLGSKSRDQNLARFARWEKFSKRLSGDKRVIAHYGFGDTDPWRRTLANDGLGADGHADGELDGAIVGANRVAGRWAGKGGLAFKQPGDRVRVQVAGVYESLTLSCWVKIDSLDRWYNSLFLTDSYEKGEPHWQILDDGRLFFSVRVRGDIGNGPTHHIYYSPPFWTPYLSGRWLHLATVYDTAGEEVTHYLNGEILSTEMIPEGKLVDSIRIGAASIGNWALPNKPDPDYAIRNLNGSMDEFTLFGAALDAEEIKEIYTHGQP